MRTLLALLLFVAPASQAAVKSTFSNVSANFLDWTSGTENKSTKIDFVYLELEGGAQYDWGDLYGFFDYENPGKTGEDVRTAAKGALNYYLAGTRAGLYAQVYNFTAFGFNDQNRVLGVSYTFGNEAWTFRPFIGAHDVSQTFYSGSNGYMAGWVFTWFFDMFGEKFMLADWHEYEFQRNENYATGNGGREGTNGAASIWWNGPQGLSLGLQWRYAQNKLGTPGDLSAVISSVKLFF